MCLVIDDYSADHQSLVKQKSGGQSVLLPLYIALIISRESC